MTFVNPFVPLGDPYQPVQNYITPGEYKTMATSVDTSTLVPGGGAAQNLAELVNKIAAASGWANRICYQTLAATIDNETSSGMLRVDLNGTVAVPVKFWPVLQVNSFQAGIKPSLMTAISSPQDIWMESRSVMRVPVVGSVPAPGPGFFPLVRPGDRLYCQWQYVNGWPNALLTASTAVGATVIPVSNTLGFYAGRSYKIFDVVNGNPETFTIASVQAGVSLTATAPLAVAHTLPQAPDAIRVSGMPGEVAQAVTLLTSQLIKTRGAEAIEISSFGGAGRKKTVSSESGFDDYDLAVELLDDFTRVP